MDLHPSGLPGLVGPEGAPLPDADYSHALRYLPNYVMDQLPPTKLDSLILHRIHPYPVKVRAAPASPRSVPPSRPLRLSTDHPKPESPRGLPSSPTQLLLTSEKSNIPALPDTDRRLSPLLEIAPSSTASAHGKKVELHEKIFMKVEPDKDSLQTHINHMEEEATTKY